MGMEAEEVFGMCGKLLEEIKMGQFEERIVGCVKMIGIGVLHCGWQCLVQLGSCHLGERVIG